MAWRTCVLWASGARGTCTCRLDQVVGLLRHDGREDHLARIGGHGRHARPPPLQLGQRGLRDEQAARPEQLDDLTSSDARDDHALEVAERERGVGLVLAPRPRASGRPLAPASSSAMASFVLRRRRTPRRRRRRACRERGVLRERDRVGAPRRPCGSSSRCSCAGAGRTRRRRRVHCGGAGRALARAAGALLAPRLGARRRPPGRASWSRACPGGARSISALHRLVQQRPVALEAEHLGRELDGPLAAHDGRGERAIRRPPARTRGRRSGPARRR